MLGITVLNEEQELTLVDVDALKSDGSVDVSGTLNFLAYSRSY